MNNNNQKKSSALAALTGAALALPAISQLAQASDMPTRSEVGYRYSEYKEDDTPTEDIITGSGNRYDVDTHQFRLLLPVGENTAVKVDALYETMTGASPMGVVQAPDGEPKLIMTGASIQDTRTDVNAEWRQYQERGSRAISVGYSTEDDYEAVNGGFELERSDADNIVTWSGGMGFSLDEIEPVQTAGFNRVDSEDRWSVTGFLARAKVMSPVWQTQFGLYLAYTDGYLSDPYKTRDIRPDARQQTAFTARSRYYIGSVKAAVHADYRFYVDDWGIEAHTVELAWYQSLTDALRLSPRVRYYSQSQADFYVETDRFTRQGDQSSDYRLSPFGAITYGLGLDYDQPSYRISLYAESYESDGDYALKSVESPNPGLVSYTLMSLGFDYRF